MTLLPVHVGSAAQAPCSHLPLQAAGDTQALSPLIHPSTQALHLLFIPLPCEVKGVWRGTLPSLIPRYVCLGRL
jgi:hypothetical protein